MIIVKYESKKGAKTRLTIQEALAQCVKDVALERAASTARMYRQALKTFTHYLQEAKIDLAGPPTLLTISVFVDYVSYLAMKNFMKKTVNVYGSAARFFMDWLVIHDYLRPDYADTLRIGKAYKVLYRKKEDLLPRFPKLEEVEKMLKAVRELAYSSPYNSDILRSRNIALVEFLAKTGCRNDELRSLVMEDIDIQERRAIVTGKGNKQRVVFFDEIAANALDLYWKKRGWTSPNEPAFSRHDRGTGKKHQKITTTTVRDVVQAVRELAGIAPGRFSPHFFRHAYAIRMLRETRNLALVQDLLGHSSPVPTRIYAKIYPDELEEAYRAIFDHEG